MPPPTPLERVDRVWKGLRELVGQVAGRYAIGLAALADLLRGPK